MTNSHDDIQVGSVLMMYSQVRRGWITPDGSVITNPLKAQRIAEALHNQIKKAAA
ncbi:DUF1317 family protein [Cronobacter sakazakii]|uniref:DUF1317 family protein n=1 Tax=Cronobacter sakazakii TaxID=28141 RepID=UPI000CFC8426|nr:DUF1317 family protein [Cronobacter sakazakii]EKY1953196.1 DUF1317 family protein [Cronobacter sakazakii]EKY1956041.1 DUF1317 family protein [Cronobacter sakazakii]EKY1959562.1 DUF1317 family protein [Cronobacter sakazakii]EKY1965725.1 DUF1317 family protein [Cronobacter sakazakii]EKY1969937.1 DUF1317 family protein [Cronobacter sakazakii]